MTLDQTNRSGAQKNRSLGSFRSFYKSQTGLEIYYQFLGHAIFKMTDIQILKSIQSEWIPLTMNRIEKPSLFSLQNQISRITSIWAEIYQGKDLITNYYKEN